MAEPASSESRHDRRRALAPQRALQPYTSQGPTIDGRIEPDIAGPDANSAASTAAPPAAPPASPARRPPPPTSPAPPRSCWVATRHRRRRAAAAPRDRSVERRAATGDDNVFGAGALNIRAFDAATSSATPAPLPFTGIAPVRLIDTRPGRTGASESSTARPRWCRHRAAPQPRRPRRHHRHPHRRRRRGAQRHHHGARRRARRTSRCSRAPARPPRRTSTSGPGRPSPSTSPPPSRPTGRCGCSTSRHRPRHRRRERLVRARPRTGGGSATDTVHRPAVAGRALDTRAGGRLRRDSHTAGHPAGGRPDRRTDLDGLAGVPSDATAVVLNVTVTGPSIGGHITVHPADQPGADDVERQLRHRASPSPTWSCPPHPDGKAGSS